MKFRWWFLLFFLSFASASDSYAQKQKQTENTSLDLIFRSVNSEDFNGSAYTISGEMLQNAPVTNLTNALSGLMPGYFSRQSSGGMKDESASYWIRGLRTTSEGVLVLIDGQERAFGTLSPYEVESITLLKDASATILYGMRAANGAILVKTRQGSIGKPQVEVSAQWINQKPVGMLEPLGSAEYATHYNQARLNDNQEPFYSANDIYNYDLRRNTRSELYPEVDWLDKYYKKSTWVQRYNVNVHGGTKIARYFINATYTGQNGMFNTDDSHSYSTNNEIGRYNIRSNVQFDVTKSTLLSVDLYGWSQTENAPSGGDLDAFMNLMTTPSLAFPEWFVNTGNYIDNGGNNITGDRIVAGNGKNTNPWAQLNRAGYSRRTQTYGSFRAELAQDLSMITKGLKVSALMSMDTNTAATSDRTKGFAYYQTDPADPNILKKTNENGNMANDVTGKASSRRTGLRTQISYERSFGKNNVSALAFYEQYENADEVSIPNRFQSIGGWVSYNYDHRYSIDFMGNYQGCFRFAPGNNFGFFPSVAAGWNISNEKFFAPLKKVLSYLKVRASYGHIGNHRGVSAYYYMNRLNSTANIYTVGNGMATNLGGYIEDVIGNPNLTWELSKQTNIGLDARLFDNRLSIYADYFHDDRSQMYVTNSRISSLYGITSTVDSNIGEMYTNGMDLAVNWNSRIGKVSYNVGGTYSMSVNKITKLGEVDQPYPWMQSIGYSRGIKRGYIAEGFFNSWEEIASSPKQTFSPVSPGDIRYRDVNGDGKVDTDDKVPIGYSDTPQIFFGLNLGLEYKGIGFSAVFQGAARVDRYINDKVALPFLSNGTIYSHQRDYWTPETASTARWPRASIANPGNNDQVSTMYMQNANYLKLSSLEVYYDFPQSLLKKSFIAGARIFVSGYNLFTWTNCKYIDPEETAGYTSMPLTRNLSIGCSIKF